MIDRAYGKYETCCDACGTSGGTFDTFEEAKDALKYAGWKTKNFKGEWINTCPECEV